MDRRATGLGIAAALTAALLPGSMLNAQSVIVDERARVRVDHDRVDQLIQAARARPGLQVGGEDPFGKIGGEGETPVPIVIPRELRRQLNPDDGAAFLQSGASLMSASAETGRLAQFEDGFTATFDHPDAYVVIRASNIRVEADPATAAASAVAQPGPEYFNGFTQSYGGGEVTFGLAGVDYVVSFECRDGGADCITPEAAESFVKSMSLCNSRRSCVDEALVDVFEE